MLTHAGLCASSVLVDVVDAAYRSWRQRATRRAEEEELMWQQELEEREERRYSSTCASICTFVPVYLQMH